MSKLNGNDFLMRYRMRYRKAGSRRELSGLIDEFMAITKLRSRKHAIRLLSGRSKSAGNNKRKPGRKSMYDSPVLRGELISIWRELDYPSSLGLVASLRWIIPLKESHGHRFDPEVKKLLSSISRSTAERILSPVRRMIKGRSKRIRYNHNPLMSEIPLAIDHPRPDEPGHLQVDVVHFSGGDASGHYIHAVVLVDRYLLWIEIEPCMGRSREAVLGALDRALTRMPWEPKSIQTDNGPEFLNDHLISFCRMRKIKFIRSRPYKKNDNAHVEGGIGNIVRKDLGYLRYESPEALELMKEITKGVLRWTYNFLRATARYRPERINGKLTRRHDDPRPPFLRACEREDIPHEAKQELLKTFLSINPNGLDETREELLRKLLACASRIGASGETKPSGGADKPRLVSPSAQDRLAQNS